MAKARGKPTPNGVAGRSRAPAKKPAAAPAKRKKIAAPVKRAKPVAEARPKRAKVAAPKRAKAAAPKPGAAAKMRAPDDTKTRPDLRHRRLIPAPPPSRASANDPSIEARLARSGERLPVTDGSLMELHWGDEPAQSVRSDGLVKRWVKRGDALLRHLAEHGAAKHEYRADLEEGRFVWLDPSGKVSAEADARVICTYAKSTSVLSMGWRDPLLRKKGIPRIDGMAAEVDDVDEEGAWRVAMEVADATHAEYLYRVTTPHAWYFLALRSLSFTPARGSFTPGTPVGLVLRTLGETRTAIESRAEPADVVRSRLIGVGQALLQEAAYAYRETDWVSRLERTGKWMLLLAERLPRQSFGSVAAGRATEEWLDRDATVDLSQAIILLEDEWALFT
ncbi:MAG: hypothetical protein ABJE95_13410 [Byssovorax sp.]